VQVGGQVLHLDLRQPEADEPAGEDVEDEAASQEERVFASVQPGRTDSRACSSASR
jgi:hypothetical protein